jgi:hypothetical protein
MAIKNNRTANKNQSQAKRTITHDEKESIESMLIRLEEDLRKLKVEFDIFFNGGAKRPPYDTKNRVETLIKRLGDERKLTFAQRYQYNSLVARYTAFKELWRRTMQGREEGRDPIAAARAALSRAREAHEQQQPETFICADARNDRTTIEQIFNALVTAKEKCGEPTSDLNLAHFHQFLATKTDSIKHNMGCNAVQFSVNIVDGKVSFKVKGV